MEKSIGKDGVNMKILVLNGSPKGKNSVTLQTVLYLQALHPEHEFQVIHAGQKIKMLERDFAPLREALAQAQLILFSYPVYTFVAPYQLHRLIELIKADGIDLSGKMASQITTSKHFYDFTAHRYIEENCFDLGMHFVRGLSADMDDLLTEKGQEEARMYFDQLMFSCENGDFLTPPPRAPQREKPVYAAHFDDVPKTKAGEIVIVTNCAPEDENLAAMIADFRAALLYRSRVVNLNDFKFSGGCLGCFGCAIDGRCVYKDGFDVFLRGQVQQADAIVYAFTIADHFTSSVFKCYDDRQFCNGHRTVTRGIPAAYIISGDYRYENNLQTIIHGRCEVGGTYLAGVATDEDNTAGAIERLAKNLDFAMEHRLHRPANFLGVGGMKIFRDLIYVMRGLMQADHRFYKQNGIYDFPQKKRGTILKMKFVGMLMKLPGARRNAAKMAGAVIAPYAKVIAGVQNSREQNSGAE